MRTMVQNSAWMFGGQVIRLAGGLLIGVWVARHLGPANYGLLSYALAVATLFGILASLGLEAIIIRRLIELPDEEGSTLGTAFGLRIAGALFSLALSTAFSFYTGDSRLTTILIAVSSGVFVVQALYVIDWYFQAKRENHKSVIAQTSGFLIASAIRIWLILNDATVIAFVITGLIEVFVVGSILLFLYHRRSWKFVSTVARDLVGESWPLVLSGFAYVAYTRVDAVMIGQILGSHDVGIYAAAMRIGEAWNFFPIIFVTAAYPGLLNLKTIDRGAYEKQFQTLMSGLVAICLVAALLVQIAGDELIYFAYGDAFGAAAPILKIAAWNAIFVSLGFASARWLVAENMARYALFRNLVGLVMNVFLNLILIPIWGIKGAAISTLLAYICANFLSYSLSRNLRPLLILNARALLLIGFSLKDLRSRIA